MPTTSGTDDRQQRRRPCRASHRPPRCCGRRRRSSRRPPARPPRRTAHPRRPAGSARGHSPSRSASAPRSSAASLAATTVPLSRSITCQKRSSSMSGNESGPAASTCSANASASCFAAASTWAYSAVRSVNQKPTAPSGEGEGDDGCRHQRDPHADAGAQARGRGCGSLTVRADPVPGAADRADALATERPVDLGAQMADVHLDDVRVALEREVPDAVEDLAPWARPRPRGASGTPAPRTRGS